MRQSCNEQMNMKSDSQFFCPESSYFILFYLILQVKLHWMSQSETLEQLVIRRGLVEVQIAATVATASYRNFSVATKLGKARRLHSWPKSWPKSWPIFQNHLRWLRIWSFWLQPWSWKAAVLWIFWITKSWLDHQGASLQLDCFCFLGGIGLFNSEAAYDAWHAWRMVTECHRNTWHFRDGTSCV